MDIEADSLLAGRLALVAFLVPFLDLGIAQDPMLYPVPPTWAHFLPATAVPGSSPTPC